MTEQLKQALDEPPRQVGLLRDPVTHKWTAQPNCVGFQYTRAIEQPPITPPQSTALQWWKESCTLQNGDHLEEGDYWYAHGYPSEEIVKTITEALSEPAAPAVNINGNVIPVINHVVNLFKPTAPVRDDVVDALNRLMEPHLPKNAITGCTSFPPYAWERGTFPDYDIVMDYLHAQQPETVDLEKLKKSIVDSVEHIGTSECVGVCIAIDHLAANGMIKGQE